MNLASQLRSVIEWSNLDPNDLFLKWTENGDEIKNASKLIVGPGQGCIFVYEGKVQAVYETEGLVNLKTDNVPFWTTIKSVVQNLESEHKVGIFFFRRAQMVNVRWGTPGPIKYLDPMYRFPVGLGAFGNFSARILQPESFFKNIVAGIEHYGVNDLQRLILSRISPVISEILGKAKFSYVDIDGNRGEIAAAARTQVTPVFKELGFELTDFRIEGTSFDEDTEARIGKIADMAAAGQAAAAAGIDYTRMKQLEVMADAAKTPSTFASAAMGLTAGLGVGQMLQGAFAPQAAPPPAAEDPMVKLEKLKSMFDKGFIDEGEYKSKKAEILSKM